MSLALTACLALVAALFASVGQAGAPGYVAVMSFFGHEPAAIKATALALTTLVAIIGVLGFHRAGILRTRDWAPFALLGIPGAVIGGLINLPVGIFRIAMTIILLAAGVQMAWAARMTEALDQRALDKPPLWPAIVCGGLSGFLAGITGVGGGLFVAVSMLLLKWAPTKRVAAASQTSNLYTAAAAFAAIWFTHPALPPDLSQWAVAAGLGGLLGVWLGSRYLPAKALRYMLATILLVSGVRLALS